MHINGGDIANVMVSNGHAWTWPLSFKICNRMLSLMVVYVYGHFLWFSFQLSSTQTVYTFTKWQCARGCSANFWRVCAARERQTHPSLMKMKEPNKPHPTKKWNVNSHSIFNQVFIWFLIYWKCFVRHFMLKEGNRYFHFTRIVPPMDKTPIPGVKKSLPLGPCPCSNLFTHNNSYSVQDKAWFILNNAVVYID